MLNSGHISNLHYKAKLIILICIIKSGKKFRRNLTSRAIAAIVP